MDKKQKLTREQFESKLLEICYDRFSCKEIGADYCRMDYTDLVKIRTYLNRIYEVKNV